MALYTPPPSSGPFNSVLPALLPNHLVHPCPPLSFRLSAKYPEPITPLSAARTSLPSIKHFDMPAHPDSEDEDMSTSEEDEDDRDLQTSRPERSTDLNLSDWFSSSSRYQHSSHDIAEKSCEMVCYLWFSSNSSSPRRRHPFVPQSTHSTASLQFCVTPSFVQFMQKVLETTQVSQSVIVLALHYIYRLKDRNRGTVGKAGSEYRVAVAALMMANKFVDDNTYTNKTWSDVSGIPLAEVNKMEREMLLGIDFSLYVDKATYESWLNLLKGLIMTKEKDCMQWRRSSSSRSRSGRLAGYISSQSSSNRHPSAYTTPSRTFNPYRARSTSPPMQSFRYPFTFTAPTSSYTKPQSSPTPTRPGAKRSAADAFSSTSASFTPSQPLKRQMGVPALSLSIPNTHLEEDSSPAFSRKSNSPSEGLGFGKLTLASNSPAASLVVEKEDSPWVSSQRQHVPPKTLSAPWALLDCEKNWVAPQNLYYYSLACSPAFEDNQQCRKSYGEETTSGPRKAKLRYHPAPQPIPNEYQGGVNTPYVPMNYETRCSSRAPMVIHSASSSPSVREDWLEYRHHGQYGSRQTVPIPSYAYYSPTTRASGASSGSTPSSVSTPPPAVLSQDARMKVPVLPPFNELVSGADGIGYGTHAPTYGYSGVQIYDASPVVDAQSQSRSLHSTVKNNEARSSTIDDGARALDGLQAAPFANAGPPGVHHYGYEANNESWELHPYPGTYGTSYGHVNMKQYAAPGWIRSR